MILGPWVGVVLALAAYRLTRLAGWDDFPLVARLRARLLGERWVRPTWAHNLEVAAESDDEVIVELPGKTPTSELDDVRPAYDRPTLAHLIHCPFCVGFWISLSVYVAWLAWHPVLYGLVPFAISGAVGLVAKNLDP